MILSDWSDIHGSLEGLEIKNGEEKSKFPSHRPWDAAPTKAPLGRLYLTKPGAPFQQVTVKIAYVHHALAPRAF